MQQQIQMEKKTLQRMAFLTNAVDQGWSVKKVNDTYIFSKKHEGKREVFQEDYLERFVQTNSVIPTK
jgi:hypothetical protein